MTDVTAWRKSTRSGGDNDSNCVELRRAWRKSTRSGGDNNSDCVELAACNDSDGMHVRDSKLGNDSPVFDLAVADFRSLLRAAGLSSRANKFHIRLRDTPSHGVDNPVGGVSFFSPSI
ncbi:hypothetical protein GCM10009830_03080 [Glycomyces endophyticus]|uniref:DUF397 domain-containing protein n=1 Tax=Glycomyces endophyticus TaxID=480996 RepID=A0ABP4RT09_9ACTN